MLSDREANATNETMMDNGRLTGDLGQPFDDGLSARALLSSVRRHLAMVTAITVLFCAMGTLAALGLPNWFQAEGVLVIPAVPQRIAELQELPDAAPDVDVIQSELDILQSRSVIEPVVRSLKLWEVPEFQPMEHPYGWSWQRVEARLNEIWRDISGITGDLEDGSRKQPIIRTPPRDTNPPSQAQIDSLVGAYAGYLTASNDGHSMTLHVSYRASTPERAAAVVNAHMKSYQNFEVETKVAAADHTNAALKSQVAQLQQQLQLADVAVARYRAQHGLTGAAEDRGGVSAQLTGLNNELIAARADLAENEARTAEIGTGAGSETLPEVVSSGTIGGLRSQEAQLEGREAELAKYHGDGYPQLQQVRAAQQSLRAQILRQTGRERAAALQMVTRSRTREMTLEQSIAALTTQLNSADSGLQQLQGKAESVRSLLLNLEKRVAETAADPALITPNSIIASHANASATSTSSKTKPLVFAGGFVGFTLGSLLSVFLELRDKGFRTSAQVQQHIGSLTVSATPRAVGRYRKAPADIILYDARSGFAEALRVSWANIQHAIDGARSAASGTNLPRTALGITSAVSGEGKSMHALALARTAALAGEGVVVVDADLRRSGLSRLLHQDFRFTLRDFLQGRCTADDVVAIEKRSGMHFVLGAPADFAWTSHDLRRFVNFVHHLKHRFAIVIIDLPPVLGLAETIRLARAADNIALVVRWGRTERQTVQFALDALSNAGASTIAVILNDVDLKSLRRRGYRDHTAVYTDKKLYRVAPGYQEPAAPPPEPTVSTEASTVSAEASTVSAEPEASSENRPPEMPPGTREAAPGDQTSPTGSAIARWYDQYRG
jgi:polysaccharide biosynthesis transport protein